MTLSCVPYLGKICKIVEEALSSMSHVLMMPKVLFYFKCSLYVWEYVGVGGQNGQRWFCYHFIRVYVFIYIDTYTRMGFMCPWVCVIVCIQMLQSFCPSSSLFCGWRCRCWVHKRQELHTWVSWKARATPRFFSPVLRGVVLFFIWLLSLQTGNVDTH